MGRKKGAAPTTGLSPKLPALDPVKQKELEKECELYITKLERDLKDPQQHEAKEDIETCIRTLKSKDVNHIHKKELLRELAKFYKRHEQLIEEEIQEEQSKPKKKKVKRVDEPKEKDQVDMQRLMVAASILSATVTVLLFALATTLFAIFMGDDDTSVGRFTNGYRLTIFYMGLLANALSPLLHLALAIFGGYGGGGGAASRDELYIYGYMAWISVFFILFGVICTYASPYIRKQGQRRFVRLTDDEEVEENFASNSYAQMLQSNINDDEEYDDGEWTDEESDEDDLPPLLSAKK